MIRAGPRCITAGAATVGLRVAICAMDGMPRYEGMKSVDEVAHLSFFVGSGLPPEPPLRVVNEFNR